MLQAACVRFALSRASTSSAVDDPGPKTLFGQLFGCRQWSVRSVDFQQCLVCGLGFELPFAQAFQRALRLRQRRFVRSRSFDPAPAQCANRFRSTGNTTAAIDLGDTSLRIGYMTLEARYLGRE